jgi:hypothetical protein
LFEKYVDYESWYEPFFTSITTPSLGVDPAVVRKAKAKAVGRGKD